MSWIKELAKRWRLRLSLALLTAAFFILFDEAVTEGYVFDPIDVINGRITHEKLFLLFLILGLILGLRRR